MILKNFSASDNTVKLYYKLYDTVKKYTQKYDIKDDKLIRYIIKPLGDKDSGVWNVCYKLRRYSITGLNIKKLAEAPSEDNEEYTLPENIDTFRFRTDIDSLIKEYQKELNLDNIIEFPYYVVTHMNLYVEIKNFRLIKDILSRMPYHIDSSRYTMVQQNVKGIVIDETRVNNNVDEIVMFPGNVKHKVEIGYDERFSVSTFIFEEGTDGYNARLQHEVERDKKFIIK